MFKDIKPRLYQETIIAKAVEKNTLVVLPTGMGKTLIAAMLSKRRLDLYPNSKIVVLAPTKPLVEQHKESFVKLGFSNMEFFTGALSPKKRQELFDSLTVIFSTPQGFENDLISKRISLKDVSLIVFDEAHRATGNYAYHFIAETYMKQATYPHILALTASPGSDLEKITEVCHNLHIEEIEVRTHDSYDVKPYVQETDIKWVEVTLPESFKGIKEYLEKAYKDALFKVKELGFLDAVTSIVSKRELLGLQAKLQGEIALGEGGDIYLAVSYVAQAMKVQHALELLETQGITPLHKYLKKLQTDALTTKTKAVQNLVRDENFKSALVKTEEFLELNIEHPKLVALEKLMKHIQKIVSNPRVILFTNYRDSAKRINELLNQMENVRSEIFVGQAKKSGSGLSQKQQKEMLDRFRNDEINVLISTSVGEEGLDIPQVDVVVFYEPVPSAIRSVQRRGRTGRLEKGKVFILFTKGTRDESYKWASHHKEKKMYRTLDSLKSTLQLHKKEQPTLNDFSEEYALAADHREKGSLLIKELLNLNIKIELEQLSVADFVISQKIGIEYKNVKDFVDSIIDGRLLEQANSLVKTYDRPIIVVEGEEDIYSQRNLHPNAIRGLIATITGKYRIPLLFTKNHKETAQIILTYLKQEKQSSSAFNPHFQKKQTDVFKEMEYIISSLPDVGPTLAKELLTKYKTVQAIMNLTKEELMNVEKIGEKKAQKILDVLTKYYYS